MPLFSMSDTKYELKIRDTGIIIIIIVLIVQTIIAGAHWHRT